MNRTSFKALGLCLIFYAASFACCAEGRRLLENRCNGNGFYITHCVEELNNWDYSGIGFIVFAIGSTIALIRLRKLRN